MSCQSISNARIEHISYECDKSRHGYGAALTLSDKERSCRNFFIIMRELLYQRCFGLWLVTKTLVICQAKQAKHAREMEALQFKAKQEKLEASRQLDEVSQQEKLRVWLEYEDGTWWCRTAWTNIFSIWLLVMTEKKYRIIQLKMNPRSFLSGSSCCCQYIYRSSSVCCQSKGRSSRFNCARYGETC